MQETRRVIRASLAGSPVTINLGPFPNPVVLESIISSSVPVGQTEVLVQFGTLSMQYWYSNTNYHYLEGINITIPSGVAGLVRVTNPLTTLIDLQVVLKF
jgi:hypothetical protein